MGSKLILPIKDGNITQTFNEKSAHDSSHIHGAIDIGASIKTPILAPEDGNIFGWLAIRYKEGMFWPELPKVNNYNEYSFCNYFYDMYGGVTVLESSDSERTHLFCHSYGNQIFNIAFGEENIENVYPDGLQPTVKFVEQKKDSRWPILGIYTTKVKVKQGDVIGYIGHAGFNLGSHLHWEIHPGLNSCKPYDLRIDPTINLL